jgi:hypothetical protein
MHLLLQLTRWEILIFLLALAGIVLVQLLTGQINTRYLLYGTVSGRKQNGGRYFSPERVQLLVLTISAAIYYLTQLMTSAPSGEFPKVPETLVVAMGGSNAIYLGGKAYARWFARKID